MRTDWILDIVLAVVGIALFAFMMLFLGNAFPLGDPNRGFAYILAFLIFIVYLSAAGLTVILKNVGKNPAAKKVKKQTAEE